MPNYKEEQSNRDGNLSDRISLSGEDLARYIFEWITAEAKDLSYMAGQLEPVCEGLIKTHVMEALAQVKHIEVLSFEVKKKVIDEAKSIRNSYRSNPQRAYEIIQDAQGRTEWMIRNLITIREFLNGQWGESTH